jgi:hypothetical protein
MSNESRKILICFNHVDRFKDRFNSKEERDETLRDLLSKLNTREVHGDPELQEDADPATVREVREDEVFLSCFLDLK